MVKDDKVIGKENKNTKSEKRPFVGNSCIGCGACVAVASDVFEFSEEGYVKAKKLDNYTGLSVDDAISVCPVDAIKWIEEK